MVAPVYPIPPHCPHSGTEPVGWDGEFEGEDDDDEDEDEDEIEGVTDTQRLVNIVRSKSRLLSDHERHD